MDNKQEKITELDAVLKAAGRYFSDSREKDDLKMFSSWIKARKALILKDEETCPKCGLEPQRQMGGIPCDYCGMIGLMPWGG